MSDIWEDEDSDYERKMADREWNRLQDQHGVIGYTEGVEEAKEQHLQVGFDDGYSIGASIGLQVGRMQFKLESLLAELKSKQEDKSTEQETKRLQELYTKLKNLKYDQIFTKEWFKNGHENPAELECIVNEYNNLTKNKLFNP
ncbi:hypothetical protein HK103_001554 [Boothiomyces macroporosus]|uniref:Protein YAE1 n=1 Tax=Boothiomyces macroporosus TaxID=261099 RepID=A0AAD5UEE4_9FUNG|nr:hypothetical protein HK103_001554 [Boothiomyces macroporosus]